MFDVSPGWHTTIQPFYCISDQLLSMLALFMLVWFIAIKLFKIKKEKYEGPINFANLIFCVLSTVLLASYFFELFIAWYAGYIYEQFLYLNRDLGPYGILHLGLIWLPLLLTQFFWRKKNRENINLALLIVFIFNLNLWLEKIYIIVGALI